MAATGQTGIQVDPVSDHDVGAAIQQHAAVAAHPDVGYHHLGAGSRRPLHLEVDLPAPRRLARHLYAPDRDERPDLVRPRLHRG